MTPVRVPLRRAAATGACLVLLLAAGCAGGPQGAAPRVAPAGTGPAPAPVTMAPIPNPERDAPPRREREPEARPKPRPREEPAPAPPPPAPSKPAVRPDAARGAAPVRAAQLRAKGLEELNRGKVARAVQLLAEASRLDPSNAVIRRDLERAQRIERAVHAPR